MVEIRKSRKEESLQKKRREGLQAAQQQELPSSLQSSSAALDKKVKTLLLCLGRFSIAGYYWLCS